MGSDSNVKKGIVLVGASGHAKVCLELLQAMGERVDYCIGESDSVESCLGVPVLIGDENLIRLRKEGYSKAFVAIGSNRIRERLAAFVLGQGYQLVNAISPRSVVSPSVLLGSGIAIMAGAVINAESKIADLAIINTGATVDHDCRIGNATHIAPQCALAGNVTVGDQCFLGVGTKVIPDVVIGEKVMVGAGSVVISDLISEVTAVGVPAHIIKR